MVFTNVVPHQTDARFCSVTAFLISVTVLDRLVTRVRLGHSQFKSHIRLSSLTCSKSNINRLNANRLAVALVLSAPVQQVCHNLHAAATDCDFTRILRCHVAPHFDGVPLTCPKSSCQELQQTVQGLALKPRPMTCTFTCTSNGKTQCTNDDKIPRVIQLGVCCTRRSSQWSRYALTWGILLPYKEVTNDHR
eukprot:5506829-Amphidinium_carterae.3